MGPMVGMAVTVAEASDSFGSDPFFPGRLGLFAGSRILTAKGKRRPNLRVAKHAKERKETLAGLRFLCGDWTRLNPIQTQTL